MSINTIKQMLDGIDPAALLPDLEQLFGKLELLLRIAVLIGPLCLLGLGLFYLLAAPKEANHAVGFRCYWGMSSVESWQFTQRTAGLAWTGLGLVMTIVMALICNGYRELPQDEMIFSAMSAVLWELVIVVVSVIAINVIVFVCFDRKGYRRRRNRR